MLISDSNQPNILQTNWQTMPFPVKVPLSWISQTSLSLLGLFVSLATLFVAQLTKPCPNYNITPTCGPIIPQIYQYTIKARGSRYTLSKWQFREIFACPININHQKYNSHPTRNCFRTYSSVLKEVLRSVRRSDKYPNKVGILLCLAFTSHTKRKHILSANLRDQTYLPS